MSSNLSSPETGVFLSLIVPTFNEESRIKSSLQEIVDYLHGQAYLWEVLVVDDGSEDATKDIVSEFASVEPRVRLNVQPHKGKGHAVKEGILAAIGSYRFLCDADLSMPIDQLSRFLPPAREGYDIAIGSREVPGARRIGEPPYRHLMGRVFNQAVRLVGVDLKDTQCGFKCYAGSRVRDLFRLQRMDGFGFDVEILFLAQKRNLRIVEVPIDWYYRSQSRVRPVQDTLKMLRELMTIRLHEMRGYYKT